MTSRRQLLIDSVKLLASDATVQLDYLRGLGLLPLVDELALEFNDIAGARDDMLSVGELTADEHREVAMLGAALAEMTASADKALWTPEAVKHDGRWVALRRQAVECQRELCGG